MTIAVEAVQSASATGATSVSTPSITPAGTNRLLMAFGGNEDATPSAYSDMTYASGQMTPKWNTTYQTFFRNVCEYQLAPSTSGGVVTYSIGASDYTSCVIAVAISGVDQTTPLDTQSAASVAAGVSALSTTLSGDVGDLLIDFVYGGSTTIAVNNGNTSQAEIESFGSGGPPDDDCCGCSTKASGASVAIGWARSNTAYGYGEVAININAFGGGGGGTTLSRVWWDMIGMDDV